MMRHFGTKLLHASAFVTQNKGGTIYKDAYRAFVEYIVAETVEDQKDLTRCGAVVVSEQEIEAARKAEEKKAKNRKSAQMRTAAMRDAMDSIGMKKCGKYWE